MLYSLQTTNLKLSDTDRNLLDKKMERLEKYIESPFNVKIRLIHDTHHTKGNTITCIINIAHDKRVFHAERTAETVNNALDKSVRAITSELIKHHQKRHRWSR